MSGNNINLKSTRILGQGTYGTVYLMQNNSRTCKFALKMEIVGNDGDSETPIIEHLNKSKCNFINIVNLGFIKSNNRENHFHIMSLYDGDLVNLRPKLFKEGYDTGAILQIVENIRRQILCIYEYNNDYVYTDLKAENILYKCESLKNIKVLLADLGSVIKDKEQDYVSTYPSPEYKYSDGFINFGNDKNSKFKKEAYLSWQIGVLLLDLLKYDISKLNFNNLKLMSEEQLTGLSELYNKLTGFNHLSLNPIIRSSIYRPLFN